MKFASRITHITLAVASIIAASTAQEEEPKTDCVTMVVVHPSSKAPTDSPQLFRKIVNRLADMMNKQLCDKPQGKGKPQRSLRESTRLLRARHQEPQEQDDRKLYCPASCAFYCGTCGSLCIDLCWATCSGSVDCGGRRARDDLEEEEQQRKTSQIFSHQNPNFSQDLVDKCGFTKLGYWPLGSIGKGLFELLTEEAGVDELDDEVRNYFTGWMSSEFSFLFHTNANQAECEAAMAEI